MKTTLDRADYRSSTIEVLTYLEETGAFVLTHEGHPTSTADNTRVPSRQAVHDALFELAGQIAIEVAYPAQIRLHSALWRAKQRQLQTALASSGEPGQDVEPLVDKLELLVHALWPVIERLARARAQNPTMTPEDLHREIATAIVARDRAEAAVIATKAMALHIAGHTVHELTVGPPSPGMIGIYGAVDATPPASALQGIIACRTAVMQSASFHQEHRELIATVLTTAQRHRRRQATMQDLILTLRRLERAVDAVVGPIETTHFPALVEAADQAARVSWAGEVVFERETRVIVPVWTSRATAATALARLPISPDRAVNRYDAQRGPAITFVDRLEFAIRSVTVALQAAQSMDGATFRRLIGDAGPDPMP